MKRVVLVTPAIKLQSFCPTAAFPNINVSERLHISIPHYDN